MQDGCQQCSKPPQKVDTAIEESEALKSQGWKKPSIEYENGEFDSGNGTGEYELTRFIRLHSKVSLGRVIHSLNGARTLRKD